MGRSDSRQPRSLFLDAQHELRQPLNALSLLLGELREAESAQDRAEILEDMQYALRLSNVWLDALADLEKAQRGFLRLQSQNVPLRPVFARLAADLGPQLAQLGLDFRVVHSQAAVRCDPASLRRILAVLLDNAGKFTRDGKVLLGCRRAGDRLRIEVWDSGLGIAAGEEGRLFDPFFRLENEVRPRDRGLGLGLTYAKLLAREAGGDITVRSRLDRWSCFALTLPLAGHRKGATEAADIAAAPGSYDMGEVAAGALGNPLQGIAVVLCTGSDGAALRGNLEAWGCHVRQVAPRDLPSALQAAERLDLLLTDQVLAAEAQGQDLLASRNDRPIVVLISETGSAAEDSPPDLPRLHSIKSPVKPARLRSLCHFALTHKDGRSV